MRLEDRERCRRKILTKSVGDKNKNKKEERISRHDCVKKDEGEFYPGAIRVVFTTGRTCGVVCGVRVLLGRLVVS